jgi:hypothetical protein
MITMGQDTLVTAAPATWHDVVGPVLTALLPLLQAFITMPLLDAIKRASGWVDSQSPRVKQLLVFAINAALSAFAAVLGIELPGLAEWTSVTVTAVLGSSVSLAAHASQQAKRAERIAHQSQKNTP